MVSSSVVTMTWSVFFLSTLCYRVPKYRKDNSHDFSDVRYKSAVYNVHVDSYTPRHRPISTPSKVVLRLDMKIESYLDK